MTPYRCANYGMGTNSTGMLIEATNRGITLDAIFEADTGDERPRTYAYSRMFEEWLIARGQPAFTRVRWIRRDGSFIPISSLSLMRAELPSKAYGYSGCTSKWKQQPVDKAIRTSGAVIEAWKAGRVVERWIGYDADEPERAERMTTKNPQPAKVDGVQYQWAWRAPLLDWGMGRDACVSVIERAGLMLPGKSACFHCPATTKKQVLQLKLEDPDLLERALAIEDRARATGELRTVKGLGRSFSWRALIEGQDLEAKDTVDQECGCFDGD
jgi:hypothetical protein